MSVRDLNMYVTSIVQEQAEPPRIYDRKILWHIIRDPYVIFAFSIGVFLVVGIPLAGLYIHVWNNPFRLILYMFAFIFGWLGITTPFTMIAEWHTGIRYGRIALAEAATIEPMGDYAIAGTWIVQLPERTIVEKRMIIDAYWVPNIREGSYFRVLLHPRRARILIPIGP